MGVLAERQSLSSWVRYTNKQEALAGFYVLYDFVLVVLARFVVAGAQCLARPASLASGHVVNAYTPTISPKLSRRSRRSVLSTHSQSISMLASQHYHRLEQISKLTS